MINNELYNYTSDWYQLLKKKKIFFVQKYFLVGIPINYITHIVNLKIKLQNNLFVFVLWY